MQNITSSKRRTPENRVPIRADQRDRIKAYQKTIENQQGYSQPYTEAARQALDIGLKQLGFPVAEAGGDE